MNELSLQILRTDISGMPLEWIDYREAARLYCLGLVAYQCGSTLLRLRGGLQAVTQRQSLLEINSIIATQGNRKTLSKVKAHYVPPLCNRTLFQRDGHLCLYCGGRFATAQLSRDHVRPLSRGGTDSWNNVVTACIGCNNFKAGRSPEAAGMELLAVPFTPTHAEYIYLQGRHVLADQMAFLRAHFPRSSRLLERFARH